VLSGVTEIPLSPLAMRKTRTPESVSAETRKESAQGFRCESLVEPVELTWRFRYAHRLGEAEREAAEIGCGFRRLRNSWEVSAFPYRLILGRPARP
jgi:hypothetical protein